MPVPFSPDEADRRALAALAGECEAFSPLVGLEQTSEPQALLLDVTGLEHLFGGETMLLEQVLRHFAEQGLVVDAALADTLGAAWALAHYLPSPSQARTIDSKKASSRWLIVPPGAHDQALAPLPIEALRLETRTAVWLHELGLHQVGQLAPVPRGEIAARFGPELLRRYDQALGHAPEVLVSHRPPPKFQTDFTFEFPTDDRNVLDQVLAKELARLTVPLAERREGIERLACRLTDEAGLSVAFTVGLFRPTSDVKHLFELIELRWEKLTWTERLARLQMAVLASGTLENRQQELFAPQSPRGDHRLLAVLVDRLSSRLGPTAVLEPQPWPDVQPEYAYRLRPCLEGRARRRPSAKPRAPRDDGLRPHERPLRLAAPEPVEVMSIVPAGPPLALRLENEEHRIANYRGPERIETGWWRRGSARRDYYQVETTAGRRLWLFRRLADNRWFFHGWFE